MTTQRSTRRSRARRTMIAALPLVAFTTVLWVKPMGLLLWARLRILTNIPRTAVAEPEPPKAPRFSDVSGGPDGSSNPIVRTENDGESEGGAKSRPEPADDERGL
jgi:hypothetical protein